MKGKFDMPETRSPDRKNTQLSALKDAIIAEQHVLELDISIVSARVEALLRPVLCDAGPSSDPLVFVLNDQELKCRAPTP